MTTIEPTIKNPYAELSRDKLINITCWVSPDDHKYLTVVYPFQGRWQNVLGTMFKSLINELKRRNVQTWSIESERILSDIVGRLVQPEQSRTDDIGGNSVAAGRALLGLPPIDADSHVEKADHGNDNRGTPGVHSESERLTLITSNANIDAPRGRRTGKKGHSGRKKKS